MTYDFICFTNLAYEFNPQEKKEIEKKIKRRLKYYQLGNYNQERVDYIRRLKNDLHTEITSGQKSVYFNKSKSIYAALENFDITRMAFDYLKKYERIDKHEMAGMINFAVYLYHLR
jgi:hypothetical protein